MPGRGWPSSGKSVQSSFWKTGGGHDEWCVEMMPEEKTGRGRARRVMAKSQARTDKRSSQP